MHRLQHCLNNIMDRLDGSPRHIRQFLVDSGHMGARKRTEVCVIANYIRASLPARYRDDLVVMVTCERVTITAAGEKAICQPSPSVSKFIEMFDKGRAPRLDVSVAPYMPESTGNVRVIEQRILEHA